MHTIIYIIPKDNALLAHHLFVFAQNAFNALVVLKLLYYNGCP